MKDIRMTILIKRLEINKLKKELAENDYKIIKLYEYSLSGKNAPYNAQEIHTENEAKRQQINTLEAEITNLKKSEVNK